MQTTLLIKQCNYTQVKLQNVKNYKIPKGPDTFSRHINIISPNVQCCPQISRIWQPCFPVFSFLKLLEAWQGNIRTEDYNILLMYSTSVIRLLYTEPTHYFQSQKILKGPRDEQVPQHGSSVTTNNHCNGSGWWSNKEITLILYSLLLQC